MPVGAVRKGSVCVFRGLMWFVWNLVLFYIFLSLHQIRFWYCANYCISPQEVNANILPGKEISSFPYIAIFTAFFYWHFLNRPSCCLQSQSNTSTLPYLMSRSAILPQLGGEVSHQENTQLMKNRRKKVQRKGYCSHQQLFADIISTIMISWILCLDSANMSSNCPLL